MNSPNKDKYLALILCVALGWLGVHRFYVGKYKTGVLYFATIGLFGFGWIIDIILIATDNFADASGQKLSKNTSTMPQATAPTYQPPISQPPVQSAPDISSQPAQPDSRYQKLMSIKETALFVENAPQPSSVTSQSTILEPIPAPAPAPRERKSFTFDEAVTVYSCTDHTSCPSAYDYNAYFKDAFECILAGLRDVEIQFSSEKVLRQNEINNPISETKNITKATNFSKIRDFIAIDTETTGLRCGGNDIIEICAIKFIDFKPAEIFRTYLKPRIAIPPEATAVNHITDDMVSDAPTFSQIKNALQSFIGELPIVAHNAPFDIKFLHVSGLDLSKHVGKVYDTVTLAKYKIRDYDGQKLDSYSLASCCEQRNIGCSKFHSADADALACGILFLDILREVTGTTNLAELPS